MSLQNGCSLAVVLAASFGCAGSVEPRAMLGCEIVSFEGGFPWARIGDINGDHYGDVLVSAASSTTTGTDDIACHLGREDGVDEVPLWRFAGDVIRDLEFGRDLNGDGYGDLIMLSSILNGPGQILRAFLGSPGGLQTSEAAHLVAPPGEAGEAWLWLAMEDVDCDGAEEIVIGGYTWSEDMPSPATFFVFRWMSSGALERFSNHMGVGDVGYPIGIGDVNGDGCGDMLLHGTDGPDSPLNVPGAPLLFLGGRDGLHLEPSWNAGALEMGTAARLGDVDSDGREDVIVDAQSSTSSPNSELMVFRGTPTGLSYAATWTATIEREKQLSDPADINGDGRLDLFVLTPTLSFDDPETISALYAAESGLPPGPFHGAEPLLELPGEVRATGDVTGDGNADFMVRHLTKTTLRTGGQCVPR